MNLKNGMKVFADCETAEYLTRGKKYKISNVYKDVEDNRWFFNFIDDFGAKRISSFKKSFHLSGKDWKISDEEIKAEPKRHFFQVQVKTLKRKELITEHRKNNTNYTSDSAYILALIDADIDKFKNK